MLEDFLVENEGEVLVEDTGWEFDAKESAAIVEGDNEEGGCSGEERGFWVELGEVLLAPLVDAF